jgi:predicted metal-dependent phosphotriesterase family hydrolase
MTIRPYCGSALTRRDALRFFAALGLGMGAACRNGTAPASNESAAPRPGTSSQPGVPSFPQGAIIRTILEDLSPSSLNKATMFHEHLQLGFAYYTSPPTPIRGLDIQPTPEDTARFIELVSGEMRMAAADGVGCIVDAALGRRPQGQLDNLRELAKRSNVHVVVAGGYYRAPYPKTMTGMSESQIADELVADAAAQRWGAFGEIGTSKPMHADERKFLTALSQAQKRIGIPIFTHTDHEGCPSCALEQLDLFEAQGVKPASLCIGHLSDITTDQDATSETHKAIARRGAFLGFDTVGRALGGARPGTPGKLPPEFRDLPDRDKVRRLLAVLEAGFEDYVMLSCDFASAFDLKSNWGTGFSAPLVQFVPQLRHAGVDEKTIQKMLVDNPRRFLSFVPASSAG